MGTYETLHKLPHIQRNDKLDKETGTNIPVTPEDIKVAQQQQAVQPLKVERIDDSAATTPSTKTDFVQKVTTPIPPEKPQQASTPEQTAHDEQELE